MNTTCLEISSNGHYFQRDGKPFFWLGDTLWPAFNLYTIEEAEYYFEKRQKQGFSVIHTMIVFDGGMDVAVSAANEAGERPWLDDNPATPNPAFFLKVDKVVQIAQEKDLSIAIMPLGGSSGSFVKQKAFFTPAIAHAYGKWLGERYRSVPNIVWANGADLLPWEYEDVYLALSAGLQEGDGGNHLISLHPGGKPGISSSYFHQSDWLAFNIIQTWNDYWNIPSLVYEDYQRKPTKPVVLAEGAYEAGPEYPDAPITAYIVRKQAYWAFLSGGSHTYGHGNMWRKNPAWRESLNAPGARQMGELKKLLASYPWWKLTPDPDFFMKGTGEDKTVNVAAVSTDGEFSIAYLSSPCEVSINPYKIGGGTVIRALWVDPRDGTQVPITKGSYTPGRAAPFRTPPGWEDALLIFESY